MEMVTLKCFENFKCIADKCSDNCCIGWEIDIDKDTLCYYNSLNNLELLSSISKDEVPHFILDERDRCPHLNKDNLCSIIINYGEDKIPYICRHHPRFYTWLESRTEMGMGICCEVASELLLSDAHRLDTNIPYTLTDSMESIMTYTRETAFSILQNREFSLSQRLLLFLEYCDELSEHLMFEDTEMLKKTANLYMEKIPKKTAKARSITEISKLYTRLVPIDKNWSRLCGKILENRHEIVEILPEFLEKNQDNLYKYEHLAVYFTYRHFLGCLETYDTVSAGNLIVLSTLYIAICDALAYLEKGKCDTGITARIYSKQVEYSIENTEKISESNIKNIKGLLPLVFGR